MGQLILLRRQSVLEIAQTASSSVRSDMHWDLLRQATEAKLRSETVTTLRKQLSELSEQAVARLGSGFFFFKSCGDATRCLRSGNAATP